MTIYKEALLDHYRNPRNRGDLENTQIVRRGRNPLCGDEVDIGITIEDETLTRVRFRGRACSICIASASIMKIGRAHVCTQVTNAHLVCRLLLEKKNTLVKKIQSTK